MYTADWLTILYAVTAVIYLVAALFSTWQHKYRPRAAGMMALYAFLSSGWVISQLLWPSNILSFTIGTPLNHLPVLGLPLLAVVFLYLSRAFLYSQGSERFWILLSIIWLIATCLVEALFWSSASIPGISLQIILLLICGVGWLVFMGGAILLTLQKLRPQNAPRYQIAATYWMLVILLTIAGDILLITIWSIPGNMLRLAGVLLATAVIAQPHLSSISSILRRSLSYTIFLAVALAIYTISLALMLLGLQHLYGLSLIVIGFLLAIPLIIIFNPLLSRIRAEVDLWLKGEDQDIKTVLRQYSQTITNILDINLLATVAVGTAMQELGVTQGILFLVNSITDDSGQKFYQLRGIDGASGNQFEPFQMRAQCALAMAMQAEQLPITQTEMDFQSRFKDISPEERAWIDSLGAEVYIPIFAKNEWIGLLTLGPKISGDAYSKQDLFLLTTMSDQTAVALENTRLVEGLMRLNNDFKRAFAALEQANQHLERLDRTKSDFINIASHELRTPLTLIRGSNQMLLDEPALNEDPYYHQLLSKIEKGTDRLHEIIDTLLDVAKIDTRALTLEAQMISLQDLIDEVYRSLKPAAIERKQIIEIESLDHLPAITADGEALSKVFHHLLINAIKYTPDGGRITISGNQLSAEESQIPEGAIEIVISDTGIGIDPRYHELIFAKFYQTGELALHSSGKTKFKGGGPGLGLVIVHGIVEAHHGKVWVESPGYDEENCPGSVFHVLLPIRQESYKTFPLSEDIAL